MLRRIGQQTLCRGTRSFFGKRYFVATANNDLDDLLHRAARDAGITDAGNDFQKLKDHKITNVDALKSMTTEDFNHIGISVGVRIAINDALVSNDLDDHKIERSNSYSGKDKKIRGL